MKAILSAAVITAALVSWQPNAHATEGQPLTRADCDKVGLAWDDNGNVCGTQSEGPRAQLFSEPAPDITGAVTSGQPLTRVDCDKAGLAWDDHGNVCGAPQLASEPVQDSIAAFISSQPLTRVDCDNAGMVWNDRANVCGQSEASSEAASKPHGTTRQSTKLNGHSKRKYTHRSIQQTQTVGMRLFRLFRN